MIKTIEIAPDILAAELAKYIFNQFGTIRSNEDWGYFVLDCSDEKELQTVIKEYLNR